MPAISISQDEVTERTANTPPSIRLPRADTAPALARRHVREQLGTLARSGRINDIILLTSEVVANAVEYSRAGPIEISVVQDTTFLRIEVSNPGHSWAGRPHVGSLDPDEVGGWGLFLVEQLSDRWGVSDRDCTVWFEFDRQ
jgi:anti-sigma regulatory factor (Ser/Thr protein kinase)